VITTSAGAGGLVCNCAAQPITIDDAPAGRTLPGSVAPLPAMAEGQRRIRIGERLLLADIRPNPAVQIFLAAQRSIATIPPAPTPPPLPAVLELEQALPGAAVTIDGHTAGEVDAHGRFRGQVPPGSHRIELSKDGYTPVQLLTQFAPGKPVRPRPYKIAMSRIPVRANPPAQADPAQLESQEWEKLKNSTSAAELEDYLRKYQTGAHSEAARSRLAALRQQAQQEQQAAQEAARRAQDDSAWKAVNGRDKASLTAYLRDYPKGSHTKEAQDAVGEIDRRLAADAAAEREKETRANAADRDAVLAAVRVYEQAYNSRRIERLTQVWTNMPKKRQDAIRDQFRASTSLAYSLSADGSPAVRGDTAILECKQTVNLTGRGDGARESMSDRVVVTLSRTASGWIIKSIDPR
jgi:hypothetical protein